MPNNYSPSGSSINNEKNPRRRMNSRRSTNREVVQSDELSSTNGARLVSNKNGYAPSNNAYLSSQIPKISSANPHPQSPAAKAQQQRLAAEQEAFNVQRTASQARSANRQSVSGYIPPAYSENLSPASGQPSQTYTENYWTKQAQNHQKENWYNQGQTYPEESWYNQGQNLPESNWHKQGQNSQEDDWRNQASFSAAIPRISGQDYTEASNMAQPHPGASASLPKVSAPANPAEASAQMPRVQEGAGATPHPEAEMPATETKRATVGSLSANSATNTTAEESPAAKPKPRKRVKNATTEQPPVPLNGRPESDLLYAGGGQRKTVQDYSAQSGRYKARPEANDPSTTFIPTNPRVSSPRKRGTSWSRVAVIAVVVLVVCVGGWFGFNQLAYAGPITATVNGESMTLEGDERSINGLLDNNIVSVSPGNYVAVDNSVMRAGEGTRASAVINEQEVTDLGTHINEGDEVVVSDGTDVMEAYTDSQPATVAAGYSKVGAYGALHVFLPGEDGETVTRTGNESGISTEQVTKQVVDNRLAYYNANTNGKKVVALTFDDGPWDTTTEEILDILKENGAKATFYTIGQQVSSHSDLIQRMVDEGHEIGTHTWDHAEGSGQGVSLNLMSTTERQEEVEKGLNAIKEVTGQDASVYFRAPGGNFDESTASDLKELVMGEIGWNIDTEDWRRPGASVIAERIKSVQPGGVVLMHDGGGDRSQTVEALRTALPYLKEQGYEFVTISELIEDYPYQETEN
jgi:peptidoglycan/xylan/chitin deacetylase (PgdA/CDA1 family)